MSREEIAILAKTVNEAAVEGDEVSSGILRKAAEELALAVSVAIRELAMEEQDLVVSYIGSVFDAEFDVTAVVVHVGHTGQVFERTVGPARLHSDGVLAVLGLDRRERSVKDFPAATDHEDRVAHAFGHVHVVC